jgi:urea ABC transporter ATP-binding protein UrtD
VNILETQSLVKRFGGLVASDHVDFSIREGELRCLIGPNGAGKTTFFNLLSGQLAPDEGRIVFQGKDITGVPLHLRARQGMGRKYQSPNLFDDLTVADNIRISSRGKCSPFSLLSRGQDAAYEEVVESMLRTVHLEQKRNLPASKLSHGERQWLEIAMVLANRPTLLLLDEPTAGMTPAETRETAQLLKEITRNISAIVIEHDLKFVREIASRITVLHKGAVLTEGSIEEIAANREVRKVYLGRETL